MPSSPAFEKRYRELNPAQKEAVDAIDGPVMVIAGPGTGKTQILTLRIANILLKTDTRPENILALTYTESGAHNMKKRLAEMVGSAAYKVTVSTFHGFANELIARYPEKFPVIIGGIPATEVESITMTKALLDGGVGKALRLPGSPYYYVDAALRAIHSLKREGVSPDDFDALLSGEEEALSRVPDLYHEKGAHKGKIKGKYVEMNESLAKTRALAELYRAYQGRLREMKRFDYEDMILESVSAMENDPDFLLVLEEWYQYLLADEHQDTNHAQNRILELLASFHDRPNIFIVGDEKQAIYRFQGASLANFLYFKEKYPDALSIALTENYRSTQTILDGAQALIAHDATDRERELRVPLLAKGPHGKDLALVTVAHLPTPRAELEYIGEEIERRHKAGEPLEEIAVLARKNSDIRALALSFAKRGLPYHMLSEADVLEDEDVRKLIRLLSAVVRFGDDEALIGAIGSDFFRLDHLDIWKIIRAADTKKLSVHEIMKHADMLRSIGVSAPEKFSGIFGDIHRWHVDMKNRHVLALVEDIIRESGLLGELLAKPEGSARLRAVDRLYDELKSLSARERDYRLNAFLTHLETLVEHKKGLETEAAEERPGVRLMSVHRAKGLEFDHVYIMNATERAWEGRGVRIYFRTHLITNSPLEDNEDKNDERRLFYVALTRARHTATITFPESDENGKAVIASRFISDIDPALIRHTAPTVKLSDGGRYGERVILEPRALDRDFLRARFLEQGLSATAFNNYLECPWQYVHRNLLRVPGAPDRFLALGTAIHAALRNFFDHWREGEDIGVERMIERFRWSLLRQPLSRADHQALLEKGEKALRGYYAHGNGSWPRNVKNEYRIDGIHLAFESDDGPVLVPLRGSLDKVEIGDGGKVNVIDYKTGKVKSRNALLGKTKDENKDYIRQLVFYKMLLEKFDSPAQSARADSAGKDHFVMETGTIEFVEPSESGKFVKETFVVTDEDVEVLEREATLAAKAIYDLSFWGKRCEKEECRFCDLYVPLAKQAV